jgi:uncharacterized membrane protein YbhN (UPF0104 family)
VTDLAGRSDVGPSSKGASYAFAYGLGALLVVLLVWAGGMWNLIANTRFLNLLTRSGVVAFTDADQGFYNGVPDPAYYVASQDPLEWLLLLLTVVLFLVVYALRAVRTESVSRALGVPVERGTASRASLYGHALGTFLPYGQGRAATARALIEQGAGVRPASEVLVTTRFLQVVELAVFTFIGLVTIAWTTALGQLIWPAVLLGVAYLLVRPRRDDASRDGMKPFAGFRHAATSLSLEPTTLAKLVSLSLLAFGFEAVSVYTLSQVFSSTHVLLNIDFPIVMMAVVAAHLAGLVEVTPGGLGQAEWGMAAALYIGGAGMPEAVTMAVLYAVMRCSLAAVMLLALRLRASRSQASRPELVEVGSDGDH